jgi:glycosyltransferase involved in cell wall biosynthesis
MSPPKISVIMPVYNAESTVVEAMQSVLNQSFKEFEFIIINDGSTDQTNTLIKSILDPRIKIIELDRQYGLAACLNIGIEKAKSNCIARMDADDISERERLQIQYAYLMSNPEVDVVGCWIRKFKNDSKFSQYVHYPQSDAQIKKFLALTLMSVSHSTAISHPTVLMKKDALNKVGGYDESLILTQDKDLWVRLAGEGIKFANVPQCLLRKRQVQTNDRSKEHINYHAVSAKKIYANLFSEVQALWAKFKGTPFDIKYVHGDRFSKHTGADLNLLVDIAWGLADLNEQAQLHKVLREIKGLLKSPEEIQSQTDKIIFSDIYYKLGLVYIKDNMRKEAKHSLLQSLYLKTDKKKVYDAWVDCFHYLPFKKSIKNQESRASFLSGASALRQILLNTSYGTLVHFYLWFYAFKGLVKNSIKNSNGTISQNENKLLKLVFVTNEFVTDNQFCSGVSQYLNRLTQYLSKQGHDIHVLTWGSPEDDKIIASGVQIHCLPIGTKSDLVSKIFIKIRCPGILRLIQYNWGVYRALHALDKSKRIDCVQYSNIYSPGIISKLLLNIPSLVRVSSHRKSWNEATLKNITFDIKMRENLEIMFLKNCRNIVSPSQHLKNIYINESNIKEIKVIPTPIYMEVKKWDYSVYEENLDQKDYVLYFGGLKPSKGIEELAFALPIFLKRYPNAFAVCIGKDAEVNERPFYKEFVEKACSEFKERLLVLPPLPHSQLYPIISEAKLITLPSKIDNLPNTCLEAMQLGKPIVGTKGTSIEELIDDAVNGYLANAGDGKSLIKKIMHAWDSPTLDLIGQKAKESLIENEPQRATATLLEYYQDVKSRN